MRSTSAEDMRTQAVSPVSILAGGGVVVVAAGAAGAGAGGAWAHRSPATQSPSSAMSAAITKSLETRITASPSRPMSSQRALVALAGANADRGVHGMNEDLAVADVAGLRGARKNGRDLVHETVGHHHLDLDLGKEVHRVLAARIEFRGPLLPAEAANLGNRHADNAYAGQRLLDVVELERLDDGFDPLHWILAGRLGLHLSCRVTVFRSVEKNQQLGGRSGGPVKQTSAHLVGRC